MDWFGDWGLEDCINGISQVLVLSINSSKTWPYQSLHFVSLFTYLKGLSFQVEKITCEDESLSKVLLCKGKSFEDGSEHRSKTSLWWVDFMLWLLNVFLRSVINCVKNLLAWYPKRELNTSRAACKSQRDGCFVNCYKRSFLPTSSLVSCNFVEELSLRQCRRSSNPQALLNLLIIWETWEATSPLKSDRRYRHIVDTWSAPADPQPKKKV